VKQLERDEHLVIAAFIIFLPENVFFRGYFFFKLQRTQMLTPV
jgi:membrane protease YdiL (CAAX protease family)